MKRKLLYLSALLSLVAVFSSCEKLRPLPDVVQPLVTRYSVPDTFNIGGTTIITGPQRLYEQESDVVFKLDVTSGTNLSTFTVTSTSNALSDSSQIILTDPADAIDSTGKFVKDLTKVTVFYKYHIHGLVPPNSVPTVTFTFKNVSKYIGFASQSFTVIKKGSTTGKRYQIIDLTWARRFMDGLGINYGDPNRGAADMDPLPFQGINNGGGPPVCNNTGIFYSCSMEHNISYIRDAVSYADKIDIVGFYNIFGATTDPVMPSSQAWICSPSDTVVLGSYMAGMDAARISFSGGSTTGGPHVIQFSIAGVTRTATFTSSTSTSITNFVTANAAAYSAAGITVLSSGSTLYFRLKNKGTWFGSIDIKTLSGNWWAYDYFNYWDPNGDLYQARAAQLRWWAQQAGIQLKSQGKHLRVVYFKRLDNITTADKLTPAECDKFLYDDEINKYTSGIVPGQPGVDIRCGPVVSNAVYGFVMDDGRRGFIRTQSNSGLGDPLSTNNNPKIEYVNGPLEDASYGYMFRIYCTIYVSKP